MAIKRIVFSGVFNSQFMVQLVISLYVLLFIYAATSKLLDYDTFLLQMSKSPLITDFAWLLVWLVPGLEILIVILLLIPRTVKAGLYSALVLMMFFTVYIFCILNYSQEIPCSCGGVLEVMSWDTHLLFNGVFILLAMAAIFLEPRMKKLNGRKR